jgi:hypothetical protein
MYRAIQPIEHDGVRYAPGAALELDDRLAAPLLAVGAIVPEQPVDERSTGLPEAKVPADDDLPPADDAGGEPLPVAFVGGVLTEMPDADAPAPERPGKRTRKSP